ncbi:hypothetical protein SAMN05216343_10715 [Oscillibacter sp. PC13]|uniref:hypothetical protein n=1 Tax=Oscillibacter sp. PC13 TaxID=1855299 RepID=UPI0008F16F0B|nr:hypothetical protein [Oscillibacter sp. PC13]SFP40403.1 hypothetical protein SAMN05216343_10715 [Oscillibacter sp. PC13]
MSGERLFRILGLVDEDLIEEAGTDSSPTAIQRRSTPWGRYLAAAACLTLMCGLGLAWLVTGGFHGMGAAAPGESSGAGGGIAHDNEPLYTDGSTVFMSYAGPVLPMTTEESDPGLTAERTTSWDFAPGTYRDGSPRQWSAVVTDRYMLANPTETDTTVTALYPFTGSFSELAEAAPTVTVDGVKTEAVLYAGAYAGGFRGVYEEDGLDDSTWNLHPPASWTDYQALLEDGSYLSQALRENPALDIPVTVYEFTDFEAPTEEYEAATQAISFTIDKSRTTILTYGFNGASWDEDTGWRQYDYFVPDGVRGESEVKVLIVLGDDLQDYTLQGYANGACEENGKIDGVSCTIIRREATLEEALGNLCRAYADQYMDHLPMEMANIFDSVSMELFQDAVAELLTQYGVLSGEGLVDRYSDGRLDDLISEALTQERVLYLRFPVTVPAGGSITVSASLWKAPSFDFGCSESDNVDLQGYDLVTHLGSTLTFTIQRASLVNTGGIELVRQNVGFDLKNGKAEVELSPDEAHYYLEVRPLEATP